MISAPKEVLGVHLTGLTDEGDNFRAYAQAGWGEQRVQNEDGATLSGSAYETHLKKASARSKW